MSSLPEMLPGMLVRLVNAPHGEPGIVRGTGKSKVTVEWRDLDFIGHHRPEQLQVVSSSGSIRKGDAA